jgi:hypothetical protein
MNENLYIQLSRYTQPILILLGTIGAVLNQILFRRRQILRTASCSIYLRVLSANDLLVLYIVVFTQWLHDQFHVDLTSKSTWYCKTRTYAMYCFYAISPYCLVLVCIDRFCRTSNCTRIRKFATLRTAHRLIFVIITLILLVYAHIPFQYSTSGSICRPKSLPYYRFLACFLFVFYCLLPPILMSIFSSWTLFAIRTRRERQQKKYNLHIRSASKLRLCRDYQLMKILFLYVTSNIVCTLPFSILLLMHVNRWSSSNHLILYIRCSVLLCNLNHCTSFYMYTLGTPVYRRELIRLMRSVRERFLLEVCSSSLSNK